MTDLEKLFKESKLYTTENGDLTYESTGNTYVDILFKTPLLEKNLNLVPKLDDSHKSKLFSMFIRDPRRGMGRRDLGRYLMAETGVSPEHVVLAGRFDDLLYVGGGDPKSEHIKYMVEEAKDGNHLAKKWLPRTTGKNREMALAIAKEYGLDTKWNKAYRELIKTDTVESKLSYSEDISFDLYSDGVKLETVHTTVHPKVDTIDFEKVPSLAMIKYFDAFLNREDTKERFQEYLDAVESGEKKLNVSTTTHYDIYRNASKIDPDLFISKLPKIELNCIPILDTSGSMQDMQDSFGKAMAIAHALALGSTYDNGKVVSFSSRPKLIDIYNDEPVGKWLFDDFIPDSDYANQMARMYTGDMSNTDFGAVMRLLSNLEKYPEYLVVLSDMEFDCGSSQSKDEAMDIIRSHSPNTKIIWWNFYSENDAVPETDSYGNIFMSGYSPQLLSLLETGFDMEMFLDKLLSEYAKYVKDQLGK